MPVFEYECRACHSSFERLTRRIGEDATGIVCPTCGSDDVHKVISLFGVTGAEPRGGPSFGGGTHTHNGIT